MSKETINFTIDELIRIVQALENLRTFSLGGVGSSQIVNESAECIRLIIDRSEGKIEYGDGPRT